MEQEQETELVLAHGAGRRPQLRKPRAGGWTAAKKRAFLETLAETCNIAEACRVVGLTTNAAYQLRKRDSGFAEGWMDALMQGYDHLELAMLDRATNGTPKPVFHAGKKIAEVRVFNEGMAMKLLAAHRATVTAIRQREARRDPDEVMAVLNQRLDEMEERALAEEGADDG